MIPRDQGITKLIKFMKIRQSYSSSGNDSIVQKDKNSTTLNCEISTYALNSKKLALNEPNLKQKPAKSRTNCPAGHDKGASKKLIVKNKTIRVLLDSESSGDLLFMKKGAS